MKTNLDKESDIEGKIYNGIIIKHFNQLVHSNEFDILIKNKEDLSENVINRLIEITEKLDCKFVNKFIKNRSEYKYFGSVYYQNEDIKHSLKDLIKIYKFRMFDLNLNPEVVLKSIREENSSI